MILYNRLFCLLEIITVPVAPTEHKATLSERFILVCALPSVSSTNPAIWMKNGRPFSSRNAPGNVSFRQRSLVFNPVTDADNGRYTCMAQDTGDQYATELIAVPKQHTPTEGQVVSVRCILPGFNQGKRVTWQKNGQFLPQRDSRTMRFSENGRTITFSPVTPRNDGLYECATADGYKYPLTIKVKPTMQFPPSKARFTLECALPNMNPRQLIVWLKDGQVFTPRQNRIAFVTEEGIRKVIFDPLIRDDSGRYTCVGPDKKQYSTNIVVDGRTAARRNVQSTVTQAFRLTCDIPFLGESSTVYWLKGEQLFTPPREDVKFEAGNVAILFESIMPEDYGKYTCVSTDGEHYTVNLNVKSGPGHSK